MLLGNDCYYLFIYYDSLGLLDLYDFRMVGLNMFVIYIRFWCGLWFVIDWFVGLYTACCRICGLLWVIVLGLLLGYLGVLVFVLSF